MILQKLFKNYWVYVFLSITLAVLINNYFFYSHIETQNKRDLENIQLTTDVFLKNSRHLYGNDQERNNDLKHVAEALLYNKYYITEFSIIDKNKNLIYLHKSAMFFDKVVYTKGEIVIPDLNDSSALGKIKIVNEISSLNLLNSVLKSFTYSLSDYYDVYTTSGLKGVIEFNKHHVAWKRTRPALVFLFLILITAYIVKAKLKKQDKDLIEKDKDLIETVKIAEKHKSELLKVTQDIEFYKDAAKNIQKKIEYHSDILRPQLNTRTFDILLQEDPNAIVMNCRIVSERLLMDLWEQKFQNRTRPILVDVIKELSNEHIINFKLEKYAHTIRAFGNIASHAQQDTSIRITSDDAILITSTLIQLIEELQPMKNTIQIPSIDSQISNSDSNEKTIIVAGGIRKKIKDY